MNTESTGTTKRSRQRRTTRVAMLVALLGTLVAGVLTGVGALNANAQYVVPPGGTPGGSIATVPLYIDNATESNIVLEEVLLNGSPVDGITVRQGGRQILRYVNNGAEIRIRVRGTSGGTGSYTMRARATTQDGAPIPSNTIYVDEPFPGTLIFRDGWGF